MYSNGKIYKIVNNQTPDVFVGCTTRPFYRRFYEHKTNNIESGRKLYNLMQELGPDKFRIELLEAYPCNSKAELQARTNKHIKDISTLNVLPGSKRSPSHDRDAELQSTVSTITSASTDHCSSQLLEELLQKVNAILDILNSDSTMTANNNQHIQPPNSTYEPAAQQAQLYEAALQKHNVHILEDDSCARVDPNKGVEQINKPPGTQPTTQYFNISDEEDSMCSYDSFPSDKTEIVALKKLDSEKYLAYRQLLQDARKYAHLADGQPNNKEVQDLFFMTTAKLADMTEEIFGPINDNSIQELFASPPKDLQFKIPKRKKHKHRKKRR